MRFLKRALRGINPERPAGSRLAAHHHEVRLRQRKVPRALDCSIVRLTDDLRARVAISALQTEVECLHTAPRMPARQECASLTNDAPNQRACTPQSAPCREIRRREKTSEEMSVARCATRAHSVPLHQRNTLFAAPAAAES